MRTIIKRASGLILCTAIVIVTAGCSDKKAATSALPSSATSVDDVIAEGMARAEEAQLNEDTQLNEQDVPASSDSAGTAPEATANTVSENNTASDSISDYNATEPADDKVPVDVDLTEMSPTMVYSEVYNMMMTPEDYVGKSVRMNGMYVSFYEEENDFRYFACIVKDATACCSQGIEFVLTEDYRYPEDYPEDGDDIVVTGVFDTYMEGSDMYCTLKDARLEYIRG